MQDRLTAGDSLNFVTQTPGYPASEGWVLRYRLVPVAGGSVAELVGVAEGADHRVTAQASETAQWAPGAYSWASWVTQASTVYTVGSGRCEVLANPRLATAGYDPRTLAERTLADLEAAFATWSATSGRVKQYTIGDRTMEFRDATDIIKQISWWQTRVDQERSAAAVASGLKPRNRILVRFGRPS